MSHISWRTCIQISLQFWFWQLRCHVQPRWTIPTWVYGPREIIKLSLICESWKIMKTGSEVELGVSSGQAHSIWIDVKLAPRRISNHQHQDRCQLLRRFNSTGQTKIDEMVTSTSVIITNIIFKIISRIHYLRLSDSVIELSCLSFSKTLFTIDGSSIFLPQCFQ